MVRSLVRGSPALGGPPRTSHARRASSFHLIWDLPGAVPGSRRDHERLVEASAVLEVLAPPQVEELYFWALQVDFADESGVWGGGHTGLQWNRRYPRGTAVNWGGYASSQLGGSVLQGTRSSLPGFADDPNTMSFSWEADRAYRFRVYPSPDTPGAWRAEVTDLTTGGNSPIRDLLPLPGRGLGPAGLLRPLVWSEVFADCDAPSVTVRWSELQAVDAAGIRHRPETLIANYQSAVDGGCPNTTVMTDERGILQTTSVERSTAQGSRLKLPTALS